MARQFSLGFKKPNWTSLEVGVGDTLTDAAIKKYIRAGKYGSLRLITKKKPSVHVAADRKVRGLINEYNSL